MATASKNVRKWRRLKRELSLEEKKTKFLQFQRDLFRQTAIDLQIEVFKLKEEIATLKGETTTPVSEVTASEQDNQTVGQDKNGSGLEVSES